MLGVYTPLAHAWHWDWLICGGSRAPFYWSMLYSCVTLLNSLKDCFYISVALSDGSAAVVGAPGSPLQVECSGVNRDYVFLSWTPPSADGAAQVQGYFIERSVCGWHLEV